jgi:hypothetical protein
MMRDLRRTRHTAAQLEPGTAAIIDATIGFAYGGALGLLTDDLLLGAILAEDWDINAAEGVNGVIFAGGGRRVDLQLAQAAQQNHADMVTARRAAALETAHGRPREATDAYIGLAVQNTQDSQNVHDSGVIACMRGVVERLRAEQPSLDELPTTGSIIGAIDREGDKLSEHRPQLVSDVVGVVRRIQRGESIYALKATDEECLRRVWLRAEDPRNAANKDALRQALFDSLLDAWEDTPMGRQIVCVTGRTARILSSLVLLDYDERNWVVKRLEQFKNDIFERARAVIAKLAEEAANSDDPSRAAAGRAYLAKTAEEMNAVGEVDEASTEALSRSMREAVGAMVDEYVADVAASGAEGAIPEYMVDTVRAEAQAAVS